MCNYTVATWLNSCLHRSRRLFADKTLWRFLEWKYSNILIIGILLITHNLSRQRVFWQAIIETIDNRNKRHICASGLIELIDQLIQCLQWLVCGVERTLFPQIHAIRAIVIPVASKTSWGACHNQDRYVIKIIPTICIRNGITVYGTPVPDKDQVDMKPFYVHNANSYIVQTGFNIKTAFQHMTSITIITIALSIW